MTKSEITVRVNNFLVNDLDVDSALIRPEVNIKKDMGLTSLDLADALSFIQRTFAFRPNKVEVKILQTLDDLYNYINEHVNVK